MPSRVIGSADLSVFGLTSTSWRLRSGSAQRTEEALIEEWIDDKLEEKTARSVNIQAAGMATKKAVHYLGDSP